MKKYVIAAIIVLGLAIQMEAASKSVQAPVHVHLTQLLLQAYAGEDGTMNKEETVGMLKFLQRNLPEQTGITNMSAFMSRQNNVYNAPRGDMTEERNAIRDRNPELYVTEFLRKYDHDKDNVLNRWELTAAMAKMIGLPSSNGKLPKQKVANK